MQARRPKATDAGTSTNAAGETLLNRLCELRREPAFDQWWQLTLALGAEECLLILTAAVADTAPGGEADRRDAGLLEGIAPDALVPALHPDIGVAASAK